jgi:hypothetical protein
VKTRTESGQDTAPSLAPRVIHLDVTPGEEVVITASDDLADWEVVAALRRAADVWESEEVEED